VTSTLVEGDPLEIAAVIGANTKLFEAEPHDGNGSVRVINIDGVINKNTLI
jgi:hypothetical protein